MKITDEKTGLFLEVRSDNEYDIYFTHPVTKKEHTKISQAIPEATKTPEEAAGWHRIKEAFRNNTGKVWDFIDDDEDFTIKAE